MLVQQGGLIRSCPRWYVTAFLFINISLYILVATSSSDIITNAGGPG